MSPLKTWCIYIVITSIPLHDENPISTFCYFCSLENLRAKSGNPGQTLYIVAGGANCNKYGFTLFQLSCFLQNAQGSLYMATEIPLMFAENEQATAVIFDRYNSGDPISLKI